MKKRDYLLIGVVILITVLLSGILWMTAQKGQKVVVTVEGEDCGSYFLRKDQTVEDPGWQSSAHSEWKSKDGVGQLSGSALRASKGHIESRRKYHLSSPPGGGKCGGG